MVVIARDIRSGLLRYYRVPGGRGTLSRRIGAPAQGKEVAADSGQENADDDKERKPGSVFGHENAREDTEAQSKNSGDRPRP